MPLGTLVQIDEKIATTDEIQIREGRVPRHIVTRKDTVFPDNLIDLVAAVNLGEKTPEPLRGYILFNANRICTLSSPVEGYIADVRYEYLERLGDVVLL